MDLSNNDKISGSAGNVKRGDKMYLLQLCVIGLALVSFYTTANGMKTYIFANRSMVSYSASAAVQGILLAMGMNLPGYLKQIWRSKKKEYTEHAKKLQRLLYNAGSFLWRSVLCFLLILLTVVILFCSTCFSYVFIAEEVHKGSWDNDSELLVQQAYRTELYNAKDYARAYRIYLEEDIGEKILQLEEQASKISDLEKHSVPNWEEEKSNYAPEDGGIAASYMTTVIEAMETAMESNALSNERDIAVKAITDAENNIKERSDSVQANIDMTNENISGYASQIAVLTTRINNATEDTDVAALSDSVNNLNQLINIETVRQTNLQKEQMELDNALMRLPYYESLLGLDSSTSSISIRTKLLDLQTEFFQQEPNEEEMLISAENIFKSLRDASGRLESTKDEDAFTYTVLLLQMNQLTRSLTNYAEAKEIEADLEDMVTELRIISSTDMQGSRDEVKDEAKDEEKDNNVQWKKEWRIRLENLKAQISAMPMYSEMQGNAVETGSQQSEQGVGILYQYDRDAVSKGLDDIIRRYLSKPNAIYQGIIYLQSPYRSLAIFALCLALAFDLSGFVFGIVIQGDMEDIKDIRPYAGMSSMIRKGKGNTPPWSILETLHQYLVLTGDYESRDGVYYYKTFNNGQIYQWEVENEASPYSCGIYMREEKDSKKGKRITDRQDLCYAKQGGSEPMDGVYLNCQLKYEDGGLILVESSEEEQQEQQEHFLTVVNEYVPIHSYNPGKSESQTVPARQLNSRDIHAKIVVVALNAKGTQAVAIYIIER